MISWVTSAATTTATYTITTTTSSTASTLTWHLVQPKAPRRAEKPKPKPSRFRAGETVRVVSDGILRGRLGTVGGFLGTGVGVLVFVTWPGGGWTSFLDDSLEAAKAPKA